MALRSCAEAGSLRSQARCLQECSLARMMGWENTVAKGAEIIQSSGRPMAGRKVQQFRCRGPKAKRAIPGCARPCLARNRRALLTRYGGPLAGSDKPQSDSIYWAVQVWQISETHNNQNSQQPRPVQGMPGAGEPAVDAKRLLSSEGLIKGVADGQAEGQKGRAEQGRTSLHVSPSLGRGGGLEFWTAWTAWGALPFPSRRLGRAPMRLGVHSEPLPSRALSHTIGSSFFVNPQPLI